MLKIQELSKVWASWLALLLFVFLVLGTALTSATEAFGQNHGAPPQCGHTISNSPPNPTSTPEPLCAHASGAVFGEDPKMAEVTFYVSTQEELYEALKSATGGETILLAAGDYGSIELLSSATATYNYSTEVKVTSEDPTSLATFSGLIVSGVSNLTLSDLVFDYHYDDADPIWVSPFAVKSSSNIKIDNSIFSGDLAVSEDPVDNGFGYAKGLVITNSQNIDISGNEFFDWHRAATFSNSSNILVSDNEIYNIRSDGLDFAAVKDLSVIGNYIHDFAISTASGDHQDFIQFWTAGTDTPSERVIISGNILDIGEGGKAHSIFMANEIVFNELAGEEMYYKDIEISENVIRGDHIYGISVGAADGLLVNHNTLVGNSQNLLAPTIRISPVSTNVTIAKNVCEKIVGYDGQYGWAVSENVLIQRNDPGQSNHYDEIFAFSSLFDPEGVTGYVVRPGSIVDLENAGAGILLASSSLDDVRAAFQVYDSAFVANSVYFDGGISFGSKGTSLPQDTIYSWQVAGGDWTDGKVLLHHFDVPGRYEVSLRVVTAEGKVSYAHSLVEVGGTDLIRFDNEQGVFVGSGYGEDTVVLGSNINVASSDGEDNYVRLGDSLSKTVISKSHVERFFGAEGFNISFDIQSSSSESFGEIFRLQSVFHANVTASGELQFNLKNENGDAYKIVSSGLNLLDNERHFIEVRLDEDSRILEMAIDNTTVARTLFEGSLASYGSWDLFFGNPWDSKSFEGRLYSFDIDVKNNTYKYFDDSDTYSVIDSEIEPSDEPSISPFNLAGSNTESENLSLFLMDSDGFTSAIDFNMTGDADIVATESGHIVYLDGKNDSVRFGNLDQKINKDGFTVEIGFTFVAHKSGGYSTLMSSPSFKVDLTENSILVEVTSHDGGSDKFLMPADQVDLEQGNHDLRIVIDDTTNRLQLSLDGLILADEVGTQFDLSSESSSHMWWTEGWKIGDGGRRSHDFEGYIGSFLVHDEALFVGV